MKITKSSDQMASAWAEIPLWQLTATVSLLHEPVWSRIARSNVSYTQSMS